MASKKIRRGRPPGLSPAEVERVRQALRRLKSEFGTDAATSRAIGLSSKSHAVQRILAGETGASKRTAEAIAGALGVKVDDLLAGQAQP